MQSAIILQKLNNKKEKKQNPFQLIYYRQDWSQKRVDKNNDDYWRFEIEHNGFKPY